MNLFEKLGTIGANLLPFVIVLSVIVFVHEMGHFLIARANGVKVKTFSIGYGSEMFGWTDKKGTRWRVSWLPFGGYVMMLGDEDVSSVKADLSGLDDSEKSQTLTSKTPLQRMMVSFGGPLFNVLFTLLIFVGIGLVKGIPDMVPKIQSVMEGSLAAQIGLKEGDTLRAVDEEALGTVAEMQAALKRFSGQDTTLSFEREGTLQKIPVSLYKVDASGRKTPVDKLGVALGGEIFFRQASLGQSLAYGVSYCWASAKGIVEALVSVVKGLVTGQKGAKLVSVFSIGDGAKQTLNQGWWHFLSYMGALSFSLGFFNLLPIPVLDGGSIFLSGLEMILRRPLTETFMNWAFRIGFGCVGGLMLWSLWNDIERYQFLSKMKTAILTVWHKFF